jgi:hypothetical protein
MAVWLHGVKPVFSRVLARRRFLSAMRQVMPVHGPGLLPVQAPRKTGQCRRQVSAKLRFLCRLGIKPVGCQVNRQCRRQVNRQCRRRVIAKLRFFCAGWSQAGWLPSNRQCRRRVNAKLRFLNAGWNQAGWLRKGRRRAGRLRRSTTPKTDTASPCWQV